VPFKKLVAGVGELNPRPHDMSKREHPEAKRPLVINGTLQGAPVKILIDLGSSLNIISANFATENGFKQEPQPPRQATLADGNKVIINSVVKADLRFKNYKAAVFAVIIGECYWLHVKVPILLIVHTI
jgi:hypothetical protein